MDCHTVPFHAVKFILLSPPNSVHLSSSASPASSSTVLSVKSSSNESTSESDVSKGTYLSSDEISLSLSFC